MRVCDPSRESSRKAHVRHLGAGIRSVPPPEVHWPVLRELPPFGAQGTQRGPPRVLAAGPLRGDDQHEAALQSRLRHHHLQATERGVRPQGPGSGIVPRLGERVVLPRPVGREAVLRRRGKGIPHRRNAQASRRLRHQVRDHGVVLLSPVRGWRSSVGLHVSAEQEGGPSAVGAGSQPRGARHRPSVDAPVRGGAPGGSR